MKNRELTPLQTVGVFLALVFVVGIVYAIYLATGRILHKRVVKASVPKYLESLRVERNLLIGAIEKYHSQFGFYPPNRSTNRTDRALSNPLYYELVGTRWNTNLQAFGVPTAKEIIRPDTMKKVFNMSSFSNSLVFPSWPTNFIDGQGLVGREEGDIIMVSYMMPDELSEEIDDFVTSPWRYLADPAEHNKGKFDLWVEVEALGQHFVIGNWEGVR